MPPRKNADSAKKPQKRDASGGDDPVGSVASSDVNKPILTAYFDAIKTVKDSPVFQDIAAADPIGITETGRSAIQAPFDPK
eukprot:4295949-Pyramimonas_sp.AAC.1